MWIKSVGNRRKRKRRYPIIDIHHIFSVKRVLLLTYRSIEQCLVFEAKFFPVEGFVYLISKGMIHAVHA